MVYQCYIGIRAAVAYGLPMLYWHPGCCSLFLVAAVALGWGRFGLLVALTLIHLESTILFSMLCALPYFTLGQYYISIWATVALFW